MPAGKFNLRVLMPRFTPASALLLALLPLAAQAQQIVAKADTAYYDAKAERLSSRVGAVRCIVNEPALGGGVVQKISTAKGQLLERIPYADAEAKVRDGLAMSWFPTGEVKQRRTYRAGQLTGQLLQYYRDGTLQQFEVYVAGVAKEKQCFANTGEPAPCPPEPEQGRVYAHYRTGLKALEQEIRHAVYKLEPPVGSAAVRVIVACAIGVDGRIAQSQVYKGVEEKYDKEALRAVNGLTGQWTPQRLNGEPVESYYMVYVDFLAHN